MLLSQYHVEPAHIGAMRSAFNRVCEVLLIDCDKDPRTEVIVRKIIRAAKAGEHDTDRLAVLVLNDLVDDAA
jgi:HD-like signal output (HDOD) protein